MSTNKPSQERPQPITLEDAMRLVVIRRKPHDEWTEAEQDLFLLYHTIGTA